MWSNVLVLFRWRCAQGLLLSWPYSSMFETALSNTNYVLIFFSCKRSRVREYSKLWVRIQIIRHGFFGVTTGKKNLDAQVLLTQWRVCKVSWFGVLGKGMGSRWSDCAWICKWPRHLIFNNADRQKKKNQLVSFITFLGSLDFALYYEHYLSNETWDHGVHSCFPAQSLSFDHTFMLKIHKPNPFVSLTCLLISNYSLSKLSRMRINLDGAFPEMAERMSSCMRFLQLFSKSQHYCFSALLQPLSLWRKEGMLQNRHCVSSK